MKTYKEILEKKNLKIEDIDSTDIDTWTDEYNSGGPNVFKKQLKKDGWSPKDIARIVDFVKDNTE